MSVPKEYVLTIPKNLERAKIERRGATSLYIEIRPEEAAYTIPLKETKYFRSKFAGNIEAVTLYLNSSNEIVGLMID